MPKRVLLVEDDYKLANYVRAGLAKVGFEIDLAISGTTAVHSFQASQYDVVLLDRMLPDMEGLQVLAKIRALSSSIPVILLSAISAVDERVRGLGHGADDYIAKPFHISEVIARIEAVGRRSETRSEPTTLRYADLEMNLVERSVSRASREISLNRREFSILRYLIARPGQIVARKTLLKEVWDYDFDPKTNLVDVHVSRIRSKIATEVSESLIHPARGVGYILELRQL